MKRLLNYLNPSWLIILIIIGLTYAQVQFDLALPDYMSNIVTEGIEYGGLEDNTLYAIRSSEMDKLECFLDEDIKANFKNGMLKIEIPKKEHKEKVPEIKYIEIGD